MYDKYLTGNTFATGSTRLPRHKGFIFNNSGVTGATFYLLTDAGNTVSFYMGLTGNGQPIFVPIQAYSVLAMGAGLTGLYVN